MPSQSSTPGSSLHEWLSDRQATTGDILYYTRLEYVGLPPTPLVGIVIDRTDGLFYILKPGSSFYEDDRRIIPLTLARLDYSLDAALSGNDGAMRLRASLLPSKEDRNGGLTVIDGKRANG